MTAISWPERPASAGPVTASLTFAWRSLLKIKHVPEQLGDVIGIPVLFTLLFTYLFGGALAGSACSRRRASSCCSPRPCPGPGSHWDWSSARRTPC